MNTNMKSNKNMNLFLNIKINSHNFSQYLFYFSNQEKLICGTFCFSSNVIYVGVSNKRTYNSLYSRLFELVNSTVLN